MNPFQMFIVIPWALSYFCVRKGFMPLKSFNLWLSWQVLSRPR
jgi:hypothetical protein